MMRTARLDRLVLLPSLFVVACASSKARVTTAPEEDAAPRVARIEQGLLPAIQVEGEVVRYSLAQRMRELEIPAISIAVFADYRLQWARAYGVADVDTGAPARVDTLFQAASISKPVNALAVMLVAADGTLGLDTPVNDLLSSWKLPDNEYTRTAPVTLRRLLSHTAGTSVHGFPGYAAGAPLPEIQQILDGGPPANTDPVRVVLPPGTKVVYSGGGTTITQLVLTERSHQPYPDLLAARVLGPLGMTASSFAQPLPPERRQHAAAGHRVGGRAVPGKHHVYPEMAPAGLWTTPSDLARFFAELALARAGRSTHVSQAIATQMTTRVLDVEDSSDGVGLGVFLHARNGASFFGHSGGNEGFTANAVASLDGGHGVVIMTNSDDGWRLFAEIERAVFAEYGWPGADKPIVRFAISAADRAKFVGRYLDRGVPRSVAVIDDRLTIRDVFGKPRELVPVAADKLVVRDTGEKLVRDAHGELTAAEEDAPARPLTRLADDVRHPLLALAAGDLAGAVAIWRERVSVDPAAARADAALAEAFAFGLSRDDTPHALAVLKLIVEVFPESAGAHQGLAEVSWRAEDLSAARAGFERTLALLDADPHISASEKLERRTHAEDRLLQLRREHTTETPR